MPLLAEGIFLGYVYRYFFLKGDGYIYTTDPDVLLTRQIVATAKDA